MAVLSQAPTSPSGLKQDLKRYDAHEAADANEPSACVRQLVRSCLSDSVHGERFIHGLFANPSLIRNVNVLWWSDDWSIREDHHIGCDALVKLSKLYFRLRAQNRDGEEKLAAERVASYLLMLKDRICYGLRTFGSYIPKVSLEKGHVNSVEWRKICINLLEDPIFRLF